MYDATSPEVTRFASLYTRNVGYNYPVTLTTKRKYIAVDRDGSAVFKIDRETGRVYHPRSYGSRGNWVGTLKNLTEAYEHTERLKVVR